MPRPRPTTPQREALVEALGYGRIVPARTATGRHIDGMVIKALIRKGWIAEDRKITNAGCVAIDLWLEAGRDEHTEDCLLRAQYRVWQTSPELEPRDAWLTGIEWLDTDTTDCICPSTTN